MSGSVVVQTGKPRKMRWIIGMVLLLLLFVAGMIITFAYVAMQTAKGHDYLALLSEQRMWPVEQNFLLDKVKQAEVSAFQQLEEKHKQNASLLKQYVLENTEGYSELASFSTSDTFRQALVQLQAAWLDYDVSMQTIFQKQHAVTTVHLALTAFDDTLPVLQGNTQELLSVLVKEKAESGLLDQTATQLVLLQRIADALKKMLAGTDTDKADQYAENFASSMVRFERQQEKLEPAIVGVSNKARELVQAISEDFLRISGKTQPILSAAPELANLMQQSQAAQHNVNRLLQAMIALEKSVLAHSKQLAWLNIVGYILGVIAFLTLVGLGIFMYRNTQERLNASKEENQRNETAIMRLLDEMTDLADGDLTVRATVSEDITGAIADSINYAIEALSELVVRINHTSVELADYADRTKASASLLKDASGIQADEIVSASSAIVQMADSIKGVSENAHRSEAVAEQSAELSQQGARTIKQTIQSMGTIREKIQDTSKRIKRLGESSQEISDIVRLINDIADQTNVLALNAAIQASAAGDAGRGFAVVADEVQQLAERSTAATRQIEILVKTIQADMQEAVSSMEVTTSNVVVGAVSVEDAGKALDQIESVSVTLADLVSNISSAASEQTVVASNVSDAMEVIQGIAVQTSGRTQEASEIIDNLTNTATALSNSVSGFRIEKTQGEQASKDYAESDFGLNALDALDDPSLDDETQNSPFQYGMNEGTHHTQPNKKNKATIDQQAASMVFRSSTQKTL